VTSKPRRLVHLDPARIADALVRAVYARAQRDARWLGLTLTADPSSSAASSRAFKIALMSAEWATTGKGDPVEVASALRELRAMIGAVEPGEPLQDVRELTPGTGLLVMAAEARLALSEGRTVDAAQVAALAGLDERSIRAAADDGTLQKVGSGRPMRFEAEVARRYLYERGVRGFDAVPHPRGPEPSTG
jgi:hypothetical protein